MTTFNGQDGSLHLALIVLGLISLALVGAAVWMMTNEQVERGWVLLLISLGLDAVGLMILQGNR